MTIEELIEQYPDAGPFSDDFRFRGPLRIANTYSVHTVSDDVEFVLRPSAYYQSEDYMLIELTADGEYVAEIGLDVDRTDRAKPVVTGYDGVFSLPPQLVVGLHKAGYDVSNVMP